MKRNMWFVILILAAFAFSGCATTMTTKTYQADGKTLASETTQPGSIFGPSSYDVGYAGMYSAWREGQAARAKSITKLPCPADATAAAYCNSGKMLGLAMMSMERFNVKAPTTGFDVLHHAVGSIVPVAGFVSMYKLGVAGVENAGSKFGDGATVSDSLNHTQANPVNFGSGSASSTANGTQPVQDPIVVDPSYPPTTE